VRTLSLLKTSCIIIDGFDFDVQVAWILRFRLDLMYLIDVFT